MTDSNLLERRQRLLGAAYRLFYDDPVHIVRGEGVWLYDADGRKFLDMYNNVAHVGHCHPHVVGAICEQVAKLNTHTRYLHENVLDYAERLTAKFADDLDTAMFCCTGSEANELALRIARAATGAAGLIVTDFAYHGNTKAIHEISTDDYPASEMPPYVVTVPTPDCYRGRYRRADAGELYAAHVQEAIDTLADRGIKPAAFVIDTIVSSGGVVAPPAGYLKRAADIVHAAGGLFVADEVQPGFGRTGSHFWGFDADGIEPDIVTLGKPMGNGHPIAAVVTRSDLASTFSKSGGYFNTFGGNPVSAAVGKAVIEVIESEGLLQNAHETGAYLEAGLGELASRHDAIGDIQGRGLFWGLDLVSDRESRRPIESTDAKHLVSAIRREGVLMGLTGNHGNVLKLRPPLPFSCDNADHALEAVDRCLRALPR